MEPSGDLPLHYYLLGGYLVLYLFAFLVPLVRRTVAGNFQPDLAAMREKLTGLLDKEQAQRKSDAVRGRQEAIESHQRAARKLANLEALKEISYTNPLVRETAAQLQASYPNGAYQRFELDLLPAFGTFGERVAAARTMAGLFVLLGLLGTMIHLNDVVAEIGNATQLTSATQNEFLRSMGEIMQGVGGAFDSSIIGLGLMIIALIGIALLNKGMQQRLAELDEAVSMIVVPKLVELHALYQPDLDPVKHTGAYLEQLNATVVGLTKGMDTSLGRLGKRIDAMLEQFGTMDSYFGELDSWLGSLRGATNELKDMASSLDRAAHRIESPLEDLKDQIGHYLEAQTELSTKEFLIVLTDQIHITIRRHSDTTQALLEQFSGELRAAIQGHYDSGRTDDERRRQEMQQHADRLAAHAEALSRGVGAVEAQMASAAKALHAASNIRFNETLDRFDRQMGDMVGQLHHGASSLELAANALQEYAEAPTFFRWLRRLLVHLGHPLRSLFSKRQEKSIKPLKRKEPTSHDGPETAPLPLLATEHPDVTHGDRPAPAPLGKDAPGHDR